MFSETTRKRLAQLIPRLASDQDGEVIGSVHAIIRVLTADGRDLHDLAKAAASEPTTVYQTVYRDRPQPKPEPSDWLMKARACEEQAESLSPKEAEFVADMAVRLKHLREPTEKQAAWLDAIYHRIIRQRHQNASRF